MSTKLKPTANTSDQSYSSAQAKVWKAERSALLKSAKKVMADYEAERRRLTKVYRKAAKDLDQYCNRIRPKMDRECANITRRIGILNGKLGL